MLHPVVFFFFVFWFCSVFCRSCQSLSSPDTPRTNQRLDGSYKVLAGMGGIGQEMAIHKNFCPGILWPSVPLRQLEVPKTDLEILGIKSENPESDLVHEFQCHIIERYQEHILIFTDGSKDQETGAAFVVRKWNA